VCSTPYEVTNVTFNTLNNSSSGTNSTAYTNYAPAGAATTTLKKGLSYPLSVTSNNSSAGIVVYIDYNDDGVFDDRIPQSAVQPVLRAKWKTTP
jgi:hypothetical protein